MQNTTSKPDTKKQEKEVQKMTFVSMLKPPRSNYFLLSEQVPKVIVITNEDATAKKKQVKEAKAMQNQIEKRMEELKVIQDQTIFMQATNTAKKRRGKTRKEKETDKETSSNEKKQIRT